MLRAGIARGPPPSQAFGGHTAQAESEAASIVGTKSRLQACPSWGCAGRLAGRGPRCDWLEVPICCSLVGPTLEVEVKIGKLSITPALAVWA